MFHVRSARPDEADLIVGFQLAMAKESEDLALDRDTLAKGVEAVLEKRALADYWMVEQDGTVKGMCMTVPEWSDWRNGTVLWVHSVYVVPDSRRQGAFRALYEHLRNQVEASHELVGLRLYVDKTNERAMRVYEAMGMTRDHYHLYEWLKGT